MNNANPANNPSVGIEQGMRSYFQSVQQGMQREEMKLGMQKFAFQAQEYFAKKELQNQELAGNAALASVIATNHRNGFTPDTPEFQTGIWEVAEKYPSVMRGDAWKGITSLGPDAEAARAKADYWRDQIAVRNRTAAVAEGGLQLRADQYQSNRESTARKLDLLEQRYKNQDEVARLRADTDALDKEQNQYYKSERLRQIDENADRLDARLRLDQEKEARTAVWVPENPDTKMPAHFQVGGGRVQFTPSAMSGAGFKPEEVKVGNTTLIRVSQNKYQITDKALPAGQLTKVETEKLKDFRSQLVSAISTFGEPKEIESLRQKIDAIYSKVEERSRGQTPQPPATAAPSAGITKEEYDKLPKGAEYVAPDGTTRTKQ